VGKKSAKLRRAAAPATPAAIARPAGSRIVPPGALAALGLACATLLVYWPAVPGGLLWDDVGHVTAPALQPLSGLWRIWFELGATQQYYPLLHSAFWIEHRLWGDWLAGYHLINIALHTTSALLVAAIVRRLGLPGGWLAAVVFALHPAHVESVAWISEQKNTLSTVFYLAAAFAYLGVDEGRSRRGYLAATLLFVCGVLSKTSTATLPAALLVVLWWRRGRLEWQRDIAPLLPWLGFGVAAGLFTAWVEQTYIGAQGADFSLSPLERALLAGRIVWFYAATLVWPAGLTFNYPRWEVDASVWWQYLYPLSLLGLAAWSWATRRRARGPLASLLFFVGTLFPVLGFLNVYPFRYSYVADHFQYVASLGLIVPAAVVLTRAVARLPRASIAGPALAAALAVVLSVLTYRQSAMYRDVETLWRETIARNPSSWLAHLNLGVELAQQRRLPEAIAAFEATLRERPQDAGAHRNLAMALSETGRPTEAIAHYQRALRLEPGRADDHLKAARLLLQFPSRHVEAAEHLEAALALEPESVEAHYNLANILMELPGRGPDAIAHFQEALRLHPDYPEAHHNLALALLDQPGREAEAIAHLEAALRLDPTLGPTRALLSQLRGR
jgi:tetratricopeptide (TPR) repeat protein